MVWHSIGNKLLSKLNETKILTHNNFNSSTCKCWYNVASKSVTAKVTGKCNSPDKAAKGEYSLELNNQCLNLILNRWRCLIKTDIPLKWYWSRRENANPSPLSPRHVVLMAPNMSWRNVAILMTSGNAWYHYGWRHVAFFNSIPLFLHSLFSHPSLWYAQLIFKQTIKAH